MRKIFLTFLSLFIIAPVFAGQYEDALRTGQPVVLYMYTKTCNYCKNFNPIFDKVAQNYKNSCRFVKVDAESPYGSLLVRDMVVGYVPFVSLTNANKKLMYTIEPSCLKDSACFEGELKNFLK